MGVDLHDMNENELEVSMQGRTYEYREISEKTGRSFYMPTTSRTKIELYEGSQRRYLSQAKRTHLPAFQATSEQYEPTADDATSRRSIPSNLLVSTYHGPAGQGL